MKLEINRSYKLFTNYNSIMGENVRVVGIRSYSELETIPFDINVISLEERVIIEDDPLVKKLFFHCRSIEKPEVHMVVWEDIIDENRTTLLDVEYGYMTTITIRQAADTNLQYVISDMVNAVQEKYGADVDVTFSQQYIGSKSEDQRVYEELLEYKELVKQLLSLKNVISKIDKVVDTDFNSILGEMRNQLTSISENITFIENAL